MKRGKIFPITLRSPFYWTSDVIVLMQPIKNGWEGKTLDTIARVEQLAAERGLNLFAFSRLCDVPYNTIVNTKKRYGQLTVDTIERICKGLGMPLRDFFTEEEK